MNTPPRIQPGGDDPRDMGEGQIGPSPLRKHTPADRRTTDGGRRVNPETALEKIDEASLISRCLSQDRHAWEDFIGRHGRFVQAEARRQLYRRFGRAQPADVEDTVQEVFLLLFRNGARALAQFRGASSISTWLACVVRTACRRLAGTRAGAAPAPPPTLPAISEDDLPPEGLPEALTRLPRRDRRLLYLFFSEGKKYREIALELGISVNSVGPLLGKALRTLRRLLPR